MLWTLKDPCQAGWPRASAELGSDPAPVARKLPADAVLGLAWGWEES